MEELFTNCVVDREDYEELRDSPDNHDVHCAVDACTFRLFTADEEQFPRIEADGQVTRRPPYSGPAQSGLCKWVVENWLSVGPE